MSMLLDHFQKMHAFHERGLPINRGLYLDVGGTLITRGINQPLWDFAVWNHKKKFLGPNIVFSGDLRDAGDILQKAGADLNALGVTEVSPKQWTYNRAFNEQHAFNRAAMNNVEDKKTFEGIPAYSLELVVDDSPPLNDGIKDCGMVISWWNPRDGDVRDFLENRRYTDFTP